MPSDKRPSIIKRLRAEFTFHVWRDNGEAWDRNDPPKPQAVVKSANHTEAAIAAYDEINHVEGDSIKLIVKSVDDPLVGVERPYWIVTIEPRPQVTHIEAASLGMLCDDEDTAPGQVAP